MDLEEATDSNNKKEYYSFCKHQNDNKENYEKIFCE